MANKVSDKSDGPKGDVDKSVIDSLFNLANSYQADMDEPRGFLGDLYKEKVEKAHGMSRKGFKMALSVDNMEDNKRRDFLRTFDMIRKTRGWDAQTDMFEKPAEEKPAEAKGKDKGAKDGKTPDPVAANVAALTNGIKPLEPAH